MAISCAPSIRFAGPLGQIQPRVPGGIGIRKPLLALGNGPRDPPFAIRDLRNDIRPAVSEEAHQGRHNRRIAHGN